MKSKIQSLILTGAAVLAASCFDVGKKDLPRPRPESSPITAASGNAISKIAVCYRNATADADSAIIPLTMFDFAQTPSGADVQMTTGVFYRAS